MIARVTQAAAALLWLVLLAGCTPDDGLSEYQRLEMKQQKAADALTALGGQATKKNYPPLGEGWVVNLSGLSITDEVFAHLKALERVAELDLSRSTVTDAQMKHVNEIGGALYKLDLSRTAITDAGLATLADRVLLMDLNLTGSKATAAGVAEFKATRQADPKIMAHFKGTQVRL